MCVIWMLPFVSVMDTFCSKLQKFLKRSSSLILLIWVFYRFYIWGMSTNLIDAFCSSIEVKTLPFSHVMALRYKGDITDGIRAIVETLGPIGLKMLPHALFN